MNLKINRKKRSFESKKKFKPENNDLQLAYIAANAAEEKKGENVILLDVTKLTIVTDYFLIITAKSTAQIEAIARHIEEKTNQQNYKLISKEGFVMSNWVVLDFGNLVVHIMHEKQRDYYNLERFWSNATFIDRKAWKKAS